VTCERAFFSENLSSSIFHNKEILIDFSVFFVNFNVQINIQ
jgi:hypothetical protein